MDESRTKNTLDDLADLFLTGTHPRTAAPLSSTSLEGPAPLRLPPKPAQYARPQASRDTATPREFQEAPTLRLHNSDLLDEAPPVRREPRNATVNVEAVVLGNLPGFGAPWLTQYAHHLARKNGPIGLLHADGQTIDMEVITASDAPVREVKLAQVIREANPKTVAQAVRILAHGNNPVLNWLVHLSEPDSALSKRIAKQVTRWTLVTGADDAAVVAGYRLIKQLLDQTNASLHKLGVMVMGTEGEPAQRAADKLNTAAGHFLATPIALVGTLRQMTPVGREDLGTFDNADNHWPEVLSLFQSQTPRAETQRTARAQDVLDEAIEAPAFAEAFDKVFGKRDNANTTASPVANATQKTPPPPPEVTPPPEVVPEVTPEVQDIKPAMASPVPNDAPAPNPIDPHSHPADSDLAQFLTSAPGSVPLQARCPRHPQTQIILDQQGALHLLRKVGSGSLRDAVIDLIEARSWVNEHLALLQLTQRQMRFDSQTQPVLHLFTEDAKTAVALVGRLGSFVKLHLLQSVTLGRDTTWVSTELN
ncbi:MAG: hypothetical protein GC164_14705 [Phycisphaera sp.]|nr:hypothetical protein [Phycisphaera sp.]